MSPLTGADVTALPVPKLQASESVFLPKVRIFFVL